MDTDESQTSVTKEMWYAGQKTHAEYIKIINHKLKIIEQAQQEIVDILKEIIGKK